MCRLAKVLAAVIQPVSITMIDNNCSFSDAKDDTVQKFSLRLSINLGVSLDVLEIAIRYLLYAPSWVFEDMSINLINLNSRSAFHIDRHA